jgi:hypothetical protein
MRMNHIWKKHGLTYSWFMSYCWSLWWQHTFLPRLQHRTSQYHLSNSSWIFSTQRTPARETTWKPYCIEYMVNSWHCALMWGSRSWIYYSRSHMNMRHTMGSPSCLKYYRLLYQDLLHHSNLNTKSSLIKSWYHFIEWKLSLLLTPNSKPASSTS